MPVSVAAAVAHPVSAAATAARVAVGMLAKWSAPEVRGGRAACVIGACSWPSMQAREVVEVTGGEPPIEGGRGGVVAPLEGGQPGLDVRSLAASVAITRPQCPRRRSPDGDRDGRPAHHDRDGRPATKGP